MVSGRRPEPCLESVALSLSSSPFPYQDLIEQNGRRNRYQAEYELADTGVFDDDRYWIVEVHYAKAGPDDLLMKISVTNAGPDADTLHVLPTAWFRADPGRAPPARGNQPIANGIGHVKRQAASAVETGHACPRPHIASSRPLNEAPNQRCEPCPRR